MQKMLHQGRICYIEIEKVIKVVRVTLYQGRKCHQDGKCNISIYGRKCHEVENATSYSKNTTPG